MLDQDGHGALQPCPEHVHELFVHLGEAVGELIVRWDPVDLVRSHDLLH